MHVCVCVFVRGSMEGRLSSKRVSVTRTRSRTNRPTDARPSRSPSSTEREATLRCCPLPAVHLPHSQAGQESLVGPHPCCRCSVTGASYGWRCLPSAALASRAGRVAAGRPAAAKCVCFAITINHPSLSPSRTHRPKSSHTQLHLFLTHTYAQTHAYILIHTHLLPRHVTVIQHQCL